MGRSIKHVLLGISRMIINFQTLVQNIGENVLPEIPGVDNPEQSDNHLSIINLAVYSAKLMSCELFMYTNFLWEKLI